MTDSRDQIIQNLTDQLAEAKQNKDYKSMNHFTIEQKRRFAELSDEKNPEFTFDSTHSSILSLIATGKIDSKAMAWKTLAYMGMDEHANWVGFKQAEKIFSANVSQNLELIK